MSMSSIEVLVQTYLERVTELKNILEMPANKGSDAAQYLNKVCRSTVQDERFMVRSWIYLIAAVCQWAIYLPKNADYAWLWVSRQVNLLAQIEREKLDLGDSPPGNPETKLGETGLAAMVEMVWTGQEDR